MSKLISIEEIKAAALIIRAINHQARLNIIYLLELHHKLTVSEIQNFFVMDQSVCSSHLAILRKAGIVKVERAAKNRLYYIDQHRFLEINLFIKAII